MKQAEVEARRRGHITILPIAIKVMEGILRGTIPASPEVRRAAAADAMDRFGLPRKTELQLEVDLTKKYVELGGYMDDKGTFHQVPWDSDTPRAEVIEDAPAQLEHVNGDDVDDSDDD